MGLEIGEYAIRLAIRQLADPSGKVVKQAAKLLFTWLPVSLILATYFTSPSFIGGPFVEIPAMLPRPLHHPTRVARRQHWQAAGSLLPER